MDKFLELVMWMRRAQRRQEKHPGVNNRNIARDLERRVDDEVLGLAKLHQARLFDVEQALRNAYDEGRN